MEKRDHFFAQSPIESEVAEHLAHHDGEKRQEFRENAGLMQDSLLQPRQRPAAEPAHGLGKPALQRCRRVMTEVVVEPEVNGFEEQLELRIEGVFVHGVLYLGIQTLMSETSLSISMGFAM